MIVTGNWIGEKDLRSRRKDSKVQTDDGEGVSTSETRQGNDGVEEWDSRAVREVMYKRRRRGGIRKKGWRSGMSESACKETG